MPLFVNVNNITFTMRLHVCLPGCKIVLLTGYVSFSLLLSLPLISPNCWPMMQSVIPAGLSFPANQSSAVGGDLVSCCLCTALTPFHFQPHPLSSAFFLSDCECFHMEMGRARRGKGKGSAGLKGEMKVGVCVWTGECAGSSGKLRAAMKPLRLMFFTVLTVGGLFNKSVWLTWCLWQFTVECCWWRPAHVLVLYRCSHEQKQKIQ